MLDNIIPQEHVQATLFDRADNPKQKKLMETLDKINDQMGGNALTYASQGITRPWKMKCEKRTPKYTTKWNQLIQVG